MKRGLIKWLILVALFGAILVSPFTNRNKVNIQTQTPTTVQQTIDYKEIIVEDLKQINKLEILQSSMKEEVEIRGLEINQEILDKALKNTVAKINEMVKCEE